MSYLVTLEFQFSILISLIYFSAETLMWAVLMLRGRLHSISRDDRNG